MIKINLLPHKKVKPVDKSIIRLWMVSVGVCVLLLIGIAGWYYVLYSGISSLKADIETADVELARLAKIKAEVDAFQKSKQDLENKLAVITQVEKVKIPMTPLLNELNRITTKEVWVLNMSVRDANFTINFMSVSRDGIAPFFESMKKSPLFNGLVMDDSAALKPEAARDKKFPFTISGKLAGFEEVQNI